MIADHRQDVSKGEYVTVHHAFSFVLMAVKIPHRNAKAIMCSKQDCPVRLTKVEDVFIHHGVHPDGINLKEV